MGVMDVGFTGDEMQMMLVDLKYIISNRLLPAVDCSPTQLGGCEGLGRCGRRPRAAVLDRLHAADVSCMLPMI